MFENQRWQQDMQCRSETAAREAKEKAYQNASQYERDICRLFDDVHMTISGKKAHFKCVFSTKGLYIKCYAFNEDFRLFESHGAFEDRVKSAVKEKIRNYGYNTYPPVYFAYC